LRFLRHLRSKIFEMIHYFNPGHEAAVLNASKFYMPPKAVQAMRRDLSYLPAWYAAPDDFVLVEGIAETQGIASLRDFQDFLQENFGKMATAVTERELPHFIGQNVNLWGISPQAIYFFEKHGFTMPAWNEKYRDLGSRFTAQKCLKFLTENLPEIKQSTLPYFVKTLDEIEEILRNSTEKMLAKSPFSSSGRGLIWLPPTGNIARSERQILSGILQKQPAVSIEKALNKILDFSMHFEIKNADIQFVGYSVFQTNAKGAYEKSLLASQNFLEKEITKYINLSLLEKVKFLLTFFLKQHYLPVYEGCIGIDMLIYKENGKYFLHPCVEINMRKSMGYLAIMLHRNYIFEDSIGYFYCSKNIPAHEKQTPVFENKRLKSGYLNLCPVNEHSRYCAYVEI